MRERQAVGACIERDHQRVEAPEQLAEGRRRDEVRADALGEADAQVDRCDALGQFDRGSQRRGGLGGPARGVEQPGPLEREFGLQVGLEPGVVDPLEPLGGSPDVAGVADHPREQQQAANRVRAVAGGLEALPGELEARAAFVERAALPGQQPGDPVRLHVVADAGRRQRPQRLRHGLGVPLPQQRLGMPAQHLERLSRLAGLGGVAHRAQRLVGDRRRAQVQLAPRLRCLAAQPGVQEIAEQVVQSHCRARRVEHRDEQVALDQLVDHRQAVDAPAQLRATLRIELVEHATDGHERGELWRQLGQHLLGQVLEHLLVAGYQAAGRAR